MPLDPSKGEFLAVFGPHDHIPKPEVYKEYLSALRIEREVPKPNGKFGTVKVSRSIIEDAADQATEALLKQGALLPIIFDDSCWLAQEYHGQGLVVLICLYKIRGQEHFVVLPYALTKGQVRWLVSTDRWKLKGGKTFDELHRERQKLGKIEDHQWQRPQSATLH